MASEASYIFNLSGQKLIKMPKIVHFGDFLKNWSLWSNSVTRQVNFYRQKLVKNAKIKNGAFFTNFCTIKIDLPGNIVWPLDQKLQVFQKVVEIGPFLAFS